MTTNTTPLQQETADSTPTIAEARPTAGVPVLAVIRGTAPSGIPAAQAARLAELLLGRHRWARAWLKALFVAQPGFAGHVLKQRPDYGHYLCLVAVLLEDRGMLAAPVPADLAHWLMTTPRRAVLAALIEAPPAGLLAVLGRLQSRAAPRAAYGQVLDLLADRPTTRRLLQFRRLSVPFLQALAGVPAAYRTAPVIYRADSRVSGIVRLGTTVRSVATALPPALRGDAEREFVSVETRQGLDAWTDRWLRSVTFPAPPWEGDALLRPIRSAPELRAIAQRFGNCLEKYTRPAFLAEKCFYLWRERVEVVVEIDMRLRTPLIGTMEGPQRREVDGVLRGRLVRLLERQGFECPPPGWWDMY